ncbi:MAG: 4-hydroxy-3-methylbut-2-en-1-yl diphosphate synthase (flavodoxin) [Bacteroidia bacterium]|nr:MAG: 4-hydroxy-3-methylbut-2-en-1-yl diphosphate synthase (flavodoxin) [Bacteroidia bacterium]
MKQDYAYCYSWAYPYRLKTHEVLIGTLKMGGNNPIVVQSMTTTDTMDTQATVEECIRMIQAGCELIRLTAPSKKEAQNLENIKKELRKLGYHTPLVADIHFTPNAAELAAKIVEKVRINPGNYADKKKFDQIDYTEDEYQKELQRIEKKFQPLLKILKENQTALRIGTNHGSLSDRIMSFYGDNPRGMVESALEFIHFCEKEDFHSIVVSMKASNTQVMVYAYRLLVYEMLKGRTKYLYPLHLGVTEAGEGADGRIKSTIGIGTLLADGLGDTIRVSLTEPPEAEIPVAQAIIHHFENQKASLDHWISLYPKYLTDYQDFQPIQNPFEFQRRPSKKVHLLGQNEFPRVIADFKDLDRITYENMEAIGYSYNAHSDKWNFQDLAADYVIIGKELPEFEFPSTLNVIQDYTFWIKNPQRNVYPLFANFQEFEQALIRSDVLNFVRVKVEDILFKDFFPADAQNVAVILSSETYAIQPIRIAIAQWMLKGITFPIILETFVADYPYPKASHEEYFQISAAGRLGPLLIEGWLDGILLKTYYEKVNHKMVNEVAFNILQASRLRMTKTEYISCPSCGRTLFDLQTTTAMIRKHTEHLKGVKIAVMGCIVNGPGEMADADYGYVGSGHGTISLYKGKELLVRDVPSENAVQELIKLIQADGKWVEPALEKI